MTVFLKTCRRRQHFASGAPLQNDEGEEYPAGHCYLNPPVALVGGDDRVHWMRPVVGAEDRACGWFSTGFEGVQPSQAPDDGPTVDALREASLTDEVPV